MNPTLTSRVAAIVSLSIARCLAAQATAPIAGYPVSPRALAEAEEIALARSAAPAEISSNADVYVLRGTDFAKVRSGTNGCACMVARDLHAGSLYPICFDQVAAKWRLRREILESSLRAKGMTETDVQGAVDAAMARGELPTPTTPAVSYMMSPSQVLFSSPSVEGVRVGAWSPHLMVFVPGVTRQQLGLAADSKVQAFSFSEEHAGHPELVVKVPTWSDGTPAAKRERP